MGQNVSEPDGNIPVTVLLPVYNAANHVAECIQSILDQSFRDFELLIINDGSTDRSPEIIASFGDKRIRVFNNEKNLKLIATLNKGIDLARGKYIARMDADDVSLPNRLQRQVDFMEAHPQIGICGTWFETFGTARSVVKYPEKDEDIRIMMLYQSPFCHPSIIFRKDVFDQHRIRFLPEFLHAEDYEAWVRIAPFTRFANIPEALLRYRLHGESVSAAHKDIQEKHTIAIIKKVFEKTGVSLSDEEVNLFREAVYSRFRAEKTFIQNVERLFSSLMDANLRSRFLPQGALEKFLADKWLHLCYNTTALGKWVYDFYGQSRLSQLKETARQFQIKFLLKAMLKL